MKIYRSIRRFSVGAGLVAMGLMGSVVLRAAADTELFTNGAWRVDGVVDEAVSPMTFGSIAITVNKTNLGNFAALKVYYTTTNGTSQVFTVGGKGVLQPILLGGVPGVEARLTSYWDCELAGYLDMGITELTIQTKKKGRDVQLEMRGEMSNFSSLAGHRLELLFAVPTTESTAVSVDYGLYATRDFCVDMAKVDLAEGLLVARLAGTYLDATNHDCDVARYTGITAHVCYPYAGCHNRTKDDCADLVNQDGVLYTDRLLRLGSPNLFLIHSDDQPTPAPDVRIEFSKPRRGDMRCQGFSFATTDPTARNIEVWGSWSKVKKEYRKGKKLGRFQFAVEAIPFGARPCD